MFSSSDGQPPDIQNTYYLQNDLGDLLNIPENNTLSLLELPYKTGYVQFLVYV